jgi:hypothetical protein
MTSHGITGYVDGCKCAVCLDEGRAYFRAWRAGHRGTEPNQHGLGGYTNYGCRCRVCAAAVSADRARRKAAAREK